MTFLLDIFTSLRLTLTILTFLYDIFAASRLTFVGSLGDIWFLPPNIEDLQTWFFCGIWGWSRGVQVIYVSHLCIFCDTRASHMSVHRNHRYHPYALKPLNIITIWAWLKLKLRLQWRCGATFVRCTLNQDVKFNTWHIVLAFVEIVYMMVCSDNHQTSWPTIAWGVRVNF